MEPRSMNFKSITNPSKIREKVESTNMGYISGEVEPEKETNKQHLFRPTPKILNPFAYLDHAKDPQCQQADHRK